MHADDENFFVIRAIENADLAARRDALVGAPEILVVQFFVAGRLERVDVAALRIHAGHYVFDGAVFPAGFIALKINRKRQRIWGLSFSLHAIKRAYGLFRMFSTFCFPLTAFVF